MNDEQNASESQDHEAPAAETTAPHAQPETPAASHGDELADTRVLPTDAIAGAPAVAAAAQAPAAATPAPVAQAPVEQPVAQPEDIHPIFGAQQPVEQPVAQPVVEPTPEPVAATASFSFYEASVPPESYGAPAPAPAAPSRRNNKLVAGMVAAALVVGAGAGIGGVALLESDDNNGTVAATTDTDAKQSPIVSTDSSDATDADSAEAVAAKVLPSVVKINVTGQGGSGSGSGIILSSDGEILTNNHVVDIASGGGSMSVNFNDGSTATATVIGTDPVTDLAVIKANGVSGLTPATLNSSDSVKVGENVLAIGSPFGLEATVTSGIVSALNRPVTVSEGSSSPNSTDTTYPAIQTDAAINPGNSGGALVNMKGEVIGINSSIRSTGSSYGGESGSIGLGFAIPISKVLPIVQQLQKGETATHARIGVTVADANSNDGLTTGAEISQVNPGSAAEKAGLKSGDVVTKIDGDLITGTESLIATIRGHRPGDTVTVTVQRGGSTQELKATLDSDGGEVSS